MLLLECTTEELLDLIHPALVELLAELFVKHGDLLSQLYTQTPAMHMAAVQKYAPRLPKPKQNAEIVVERRMHNMIFDHQRYLPLPTAHCTLAALTDCTDFALVGHTNCTQLPTDCTLTAY